MKKFLQNKKGRYSFRQSKRGPRCPSKDFCKSFVRFVQHAIAAVCCFGGWGASSWVLWQIMFSKSQHLNYSESVFFIYKLFLSVDKYLQHVSECCIVFLTDPQCSYIMAGETCMCTELQEELLPPKAIKVTICVTP